MKDAKKKKKQSAKLLDKQKLVVKNKIHTASKVKNIKICHITKKVIMKKYKN